LLRDIGDDVWRGKGDRCSPAERCLLQLASSAGPSAPPPRHWRNHRDSCLQSALETLFSPPTTHSCRTPHPPQMFHVGHRCQHIRLPVGGSAMLESRGNSLDDRDAFCHATGLCLPSH
jgi:hypothetical protein